MGMVELGWRGIACTPIEQGDGAIVSPIVSKVGDLNDLLPADAAASTTGWSGTEYRVAFGLFEQCRWRVVSLSI
jgi:hypothetical protein